MFPWFKKVRHHRIVVTSLYGEVTTAYRGTDNKEAERIYNDLRVDYDSNASLLLFSVVWYRDGERYKQF